MAALLACGAAAGQAGAQPSSLYTVSNVDVDVTDKDASTAKVKAISEAQVKAFGILAERLAGADAANAVQYLEAGEIGRMMASLSIQSEKSGPGRYIGRLSITFLPTQVRETFTRLGLEISENRAPRIVILPVWGGPDGASAWEDNPWRRAWLDLNSENDLVPIIVPLGDLEDSAAITAEEALRGDEVKLESIKIRYEAEVILVAFAEPAGDNSIHAVMSGQSPLGIMAFDKIYEAEAGGHAGAAAIAAQRFVSVINDKWKQGQSASTAAAKPARVLEVAVPFSSTAQWNAIRARLLSVEGVSGVDVTTISVGGARVRVAISSSVGDFQQALAVVGMKLVDRSGALVLQPL
ncbi:MAG: DUF2066 domain-containing protein [Pseudomonadota bacterium]|nr:DUF2066 domain-containing protein [Pseudomonadota bacterium]